MPAKKSTSTKTKSRAAAKKKPAARKKKAPAAKVAATPAPANVCVNCAPLPMGHTQVLAMMVVSVFAVSGVLLTAVAMVNQQGKIISDQATVIEQLSVEGLEQ